MLKHKFFVTAKSLCSFVNKKNCEVVSISGTNLLFYRDKNLTSASIKEWFMIITDIEIRENALREMKNDDYIESSLPSAIFNGINWHESVKGYSYWEKVVKNL